MPDPLTAPGAILAIVDVMTELRELITRLHGTAPRGSWLPGPLVSAATPGSEPYCSHVEPMVAVVVAGENRMALAGHEFRYRPANTWSSRWNWRSPPGSPGRPFLAAGVRLRA
jgi:hypothetical protein